MTETRPTTRQILATVQEVLPATGLAYAVDDNQHTWGITRSARGVDLANLRPGQRIELTVTDHRDFDLVSGCTLLD